MRGLRHRERHGGASCLTASGIWGPRYGSCFRWPSDKPHINPCPPITSRRCENRLCQLVHGSGQCLRLPPAAIFSILKAASLSASAPILAAAPLIPWARSSVRLASLAPWPPASPAICTQVPQKGAADLPGQLAVAHALSRKASLSKTARVLSGPRRAALSSASPAVPEFGSLFPHNHRSKTWQAHRAARACSGSHPSGRQQRSRSPFMQKRSWAMMGIPPFMTSRPGLADAARRLESIHLRHLAVHEHQIIGNPRNASNTSRPFAATSRLRPSFRRMLRATIWFVGLSSAAAGGPAPGAVLKVCGGSQDLRRPELVSPLSGNHKGKALTEMGLTQRFRQVTGETMSRKRVPSRARQRR